MLIAVSFVIAIGFGILTPALPTFARSFERQRHRGLGRDQNLRPHPVAVRPGERRHSGPRPPRAARRQVTEAIAPADTLDQHWRARAVDETRRLARPHRAHPRRRGPGPPPS
jgi:hypothetical protein